MKYPLQAQATQSSEGFQRAVVALPKTAQILHLGSSPPNEEISLYALVPPKLDKDGKVTPYLPHEVGALEFYVVIPGQAVPAGLLFRGPVRTPKGLIFLFERAPTQKLILPGS
jgi:hypothetical protein